MYAVMLLRRRNHKDEEYGRVMPVGDDIKFEGLSSIFQACLWQGIKDMQNCTCTPKDGIAFLKNLKHHHFDICLRATDIEETPEA